MTQLQTENFTVHAATNGVIMCQNAKGVSFKALLKRGPDWEYDTRTGEDETEESVR